MLRSIFDYFTLRSPLDCIASSERKAGYFAIFKGDLCRNECVFYFSEFLIVNVSTLFSLCKWRRSETVASLGILFVVSLVKFLKYFEECSFCCVNFLASLSTLFSVVVKANLYLGFLYLISKAAAQEMNLCMKLSLRAWYESRVFRACIASSLPSEGEPVLHSFFALFRLLCIGRTTSGGIKVGLARLLLRTADQPGFFL